METLNSNQVRICVPVFAETLEELRNEIGQAENHADFIELRLDCLRTDELTKLLAEIDALVRETKRPLILTPRTKAHGGKCELPNDELCRYALRLITAAFGTDSYVDIELETCEQLHTDHWDRVICSFHDFEGTPVNLGSVYEQMAKLPAAVLKIAVTAKSPSDCEAIYKLIARANLDGRKIIAIAMGDLGAETRTKGPLIGSFLTYAVVNEDRRTAPGQLTVNELRKQMNELTTI